MLHTILKNEGFARLGRLALSHGEVVTPVFMPVGTYGAVKTMGSHELDALGTQILLGNTYHLYLRPGLEVLKAAGGLHKFMGWKKPILTDSGGFQVFSLAKNRKLEEEGVSFQSHIDGSRVHLTPELSAEIQQVIGSDVAMVFDECPALPSTPEALRSAVDRSLRWARRFMNVPRLEGQKIFSIVQGGTSVPLRLESLDGTCSLPIDGLAIGGLSVGESHIEMVATLAGMAPHLPSTLPHYLMGVGTPLDILEAVFWGIDMFDCVLPTRNARNGGFFTDEGLLNIRNSRFRLDQAPIAENCPGICCRNYSRSYLRHLFLTKEILGCRLATLHNLHYYHGLMSDIRNALQQSCFGTFYQTKLPLLRAAYGKAGVTFEGEPECEVDG